jgi:hypothetical protein
MKRCWILSDGLFCMYGEDNVGFFPCFCLYAVLHLWIYICEPSLHPWDESDLVGFMIFWCVVDFCLLVFCWGSSHIFSLKILVYSSIFWLHFYWVLEWV